MSFTSRATPACACASTPPRPRTPVPSRASSGATFRHRVYGRNAWVVQRARPFFFPAVRAGEAGVMQQTNAAVMAAARSAGFR